MGTLFKEELMDNTANTPIIEMQFSERSIAWDSIVEKFNDTATISIDYDILLLKIHKMECGLFHDPDEFEISLYLAHTDGSIVNVTIPDDSLEYAVIMLDDEEPEYIVIKTIH